MQKNNMQNDKDQISIDPVSSLGQKVPQVSWFSVYAEAMKDGFLRAWKNRWLWFWGILLPAGGFGFNLNIGGGNDGGFDEKQKGFIENEVVPFLQEYRIWFVVGIGLFVLLCLVFWVLSAIARSGVIKALDEMQEKKPLTYTFGKVWREGRREMKRLLLLDLLIGLGSLILIVVFVSPSILLFLTGTEELVATGVFLLLLAFLFIILVIIFASYLKSMATVMLVLSKVKVSTAVGRAYSMVTKNIKEVLKLMLFKVIMGIAYGIAGAVVFIPLIIFGVIIFTISGGMVLFEKWPGIFSEFPVAVLVSVGLFLIFSLLVSFLMKGIFSLWSQDLWLWWTKKIGALKITEEEKVEVLEKIGEKRKAAVLESER